MTDHNKTAKQTFAKKTFTSDEYIAQYFRAFTILNDLVSGIDSSTQLLEAITRKPKQTAEDERAAEYHRNNIELFKANRNILKSTIFSRVNMRDLKSAVADTNKKSQSAIVETPSTNIVRF